MGGACSTYGKRRSVYRFLVGKPEEKEPLGRSRHRWEDNIKMYLQVVGCEAWTKLIWFRKGSGGGQL